MHKVVHIRPLDDVFGHEESADCLCGPAGEGVYAQAAAEAVGMIYRHHALRPCLDWEASAEG
ncbi:hypothetical protein [Planomonospora sp. ID82291]|uniref:hypothetical protein n=1 Tax=Planomonospora sp. ID82291 TaxID=2738136 RepID=UPI0018C37653|nr:hypothetical protein [Planomonospora sp. ID82291]MBG0817162.1 hypothetical protein [Planomonospora sp. ID82291]